MTDRATTRPTEPPEPAAVVDVGSNSVLLLVAAFGPDGRRHIIREALETTRLGEGLHGGGALDPAARARTLEAVVRLVGTARSEGVRRPAVLGTAALRRARDGAEFAAELGAAIGGSVDVLSGEREAELAWSAAAAVDTRAGPRLVLDVGAGSTELALGEGAVLRESASVPVGALSLTEACRGRECPRFGTLRAAAAVALRDTELLRRARDVSVVATGGTATALAATDLGLGRYDHDRVHGHVLRLAALEDLATRPSPALDRGRAAILPAGAALVGAVAAAVGAGQIWVSARGIRHAYLDRQLGGAP